MNSAPALLMLLFVFKLCQNELQKVLGSGICLALKSCRLGCRCRFCCCRLICKSLLFSKVGCNCCLVGYLYAVRTKLLDLLAGKLFLSKLGLLLTKLVDELDDGEQHQCGDEEIKKPQSKKMDCARSIS